MGAKSSFTVGRVRAWISGNTVAIAVAIVLLFILAALIRLWMQPAQLAVAALTAIIVSVVALAIIAIAALAALCRIEATRSLGAVTLDAISQRATNDLVKVREFAERDLAAIRENAEASIKAAQDATLSKADTAAHFERLRFTEIVLGGRDLREVEEWLDSVFLANQGNVRKVRDDLTRRLALSEIDATRQAMTIYGVIAVLAEYYYSDLVVPEIVLSRTATRVQLANYYFGAAFSALGLINRARSENVQMFLDETRRFTQENETWLEELIPEFYNEIDIDGGAAASVTMGEIDFEPLQQEAAT